MEVNHEMSAAERNFVKEENRAREIRQNLDRMGLSAYFSVFAENLWQYYEEHVICDPHGKAVICSNPFYYHVSEVVGDLLGKKIEVMKLKGEGGKIHVFTTIESLSIPERHTLATMNRYFNEYRPGFHASHGDINLPHALHALATPSNFLNEADAFELAAAIEEAFCADSVDVMTTDEGFAVVVRNEDGDLNGWASERIAGIAKVVEAFSLTPKRKISFDMTGGEEAHYSSALWQFRTADRHTQQQRIESKLDALLSRLDAHIDPHRDTKAAKDAPAAVDAFAEEGKDPHTLPGKPAAKSKSRK